MKMAHFDSVMVIVQSRSAETFSDAWLVDGDRGSVGD